MDWWRDKENEITDIEITDRGVNTLCGRKVNGEWEYALVEWMYNSPKLKIAFKNGKIVECA